MKSDRHRASFLAYCPDFVIVDQAHTCSNSSADGSPVAEVHSRWDKAVDRQKQSRTKFAQQSIKPVEIETELQAANRILGSSEDVERFVRTACERLRSSLKREKKWWVMATPPECLIL